MARKWWTLGAVTFGLFMVMLDNTVVNVALPTIGRELSMSVSNLEWVVNAYTLTLAVLMLSGGALADRYGRRRFFVIGLVVFTSSSLACGLAQGAEWLLAARTVQGAGAALMAPATLSIITATFPPEERGTAIGTWAGISALAIGIGPLVGGLLTEHIAWNWIFFVNVPIGALAIVAAFAFIDESRDERPSRRLDVPGILTSGIALFSLTYALIESNKYGWGSTRILTLFAISAAGFVAFVLLERSQRAPMLDLRLFRNRTFSAANTVALLVGIALFGVVFYISLYMQRILGYSPVRAGAAQLPYTILLVFSAPIGGRLTDRLGPRLPIAFGAAMMALSFLLLSRVGVHSHYLTLLPGMLVGGTGVGFAMGPTTTAVLSAVAVDEAGVGSGVVNTFRQTGGALGIATMGAIVAAAISAVPGTAAYAPEFVTGLRHAMLTSAAILLAGCVVALAGIADVRQLGWRGTLAALRPGRTSAVDA
jgi:EmrB/QacA subfamily drug resistance transporter